jgi:hypothetical protein
MARVRNGDHPSVGVKGESRLADESEVVHTSALKMRSPADFFFMAARAGSTMASILGVQCFLAREALGWTWR